MSTSKIRHNSLRIARLAQTIILVLALLANILPIAPLTHTAFAAGGDFKNTDFIAAAPFTYDHNTGGGAYDDRTVGDYDDVVEQLEGAEFACGDVVTFLAAIELEAATVDAVQTAEFDFRFLGDPTGQSGAAIVDILGVSINYGPVQAGDGPGGTDSFIQDDGGSTATLVSETIVGTLFTPGAEVRGSVQVTDLEAGERVLLRIDTLLECQPDTSPTGNIQGQLDAGRVVESGDTINTGQQTIPFLRVGDIAGAGEPLLKIQKTVTTADGVCDVDDADELTVFDGETVKYCYEVSNPGTYPLYDVEVIDDNGTVSTSDDFAVTLSGLTDLDGDGANDDLASGVTATGAALVTLNVGGTITNIAEGTGNNGSPGGNYAELSASDTASVTVEAPPNSPPVANDDSANTDEDTPVTIDAAANDSDVDDNLDPASAIALSQPANGSLINNGDGTFTYTPNENFNGTDSFDYQICDLNGLCDTATVTINVTPTNDPPVANVDSVGTPEDTPVTFDVLGNDSDIDGDSLSVSSYTQPEHGLLTQNADGSFTYTPDADYCGSDSFTYTISDGNGGFDTATVSIDVACVNDAPTAENDAYSTDEDTPLTVPAPGILVNDSDVDGDALTAKLLTNPSHGTLAQNADGSFTYTPNPDFSGVDSYTYEACDASGACDSATVTITVNPVNDPPVANDDTASTDEDVSVTIPVLENDIDIDGDTLTVTAVSDPPHGTATINPDGSITYTPDPDYFGDDSFTYTICDPSGACAMATVTVVIGAINDPPEANADSATTDEDTSVTIDAAANDSDVDGNLDPASATALIQPFNGSLTKNGDGTFTYTPDENFHGSDSFTYQICDTDGLCDSATVTITIKPVNDAPVANVDSVGTPEDTPVTFDVLGNDSDIDGDSLSVSSFTQPAHGLLTQNADGSFTYTPDADYCGSDDSFTYTISDGNGGFDTATVSIDVECVNDAPVAVDDAYSTDEDTPLTVPAPGILVNDSDVDGDPLTAKLLTSPSYGTLTQNADGSFTYTPNENFNGSDSFTYQICDLDDLCDSATVTITVNPINDPPVANDDAYTTQQDTTLVIAADGGLLLNDSDPIEGDAISVDSDSYDATSQFGGSVSVNADGSFSYSPAPGFAGYDTFTYTISDGNGGYDTATVTIEVTAKNGRSISVSWGDWTLAGSDLSGYFNIQNQSNGYNVQLQGYEIILQYRENGPGKKEWIHVAVEGCAFSPDTPTILVDTLTVDFSGCELQASIPAGSTVRVTAVVGIYGHKDKGHQKQTFLSRLSKDTF